MDIPLYFLKVICMGGKLFRRNFCLKKPNAPDYAQVLVLMWEKLNYVTTLLSPRPIILE